MLMIKSYLERQQISQSEFAKMIGVTVGAVNHYVTGRRAPQPKIAEKIETVTGIPFKALMLQKDRKTA